MVGRTEVLICYWEVARLDMTMRMMPKYFVRLLRGIFLMRVDECSELNYPGVESSIVMIYP